MTTTDPDGSRDEPTTRSEAVALEEPPTAVQPVAPVAEGPVASATADGAGPRRPRWWRVPGWARGIRARVVLGYVLLVAGALGVTLLVVRQGLLDRTDRQIEEAMAQEVEELRRLAVGTDPATGRPFGTDAAAIFDLFLSRTVLAEGEVLLTLVDGLPHKETLGAPVDLAQDPDLVERWATLEEPLRMDVGSGPEEARTLAVPLLDDEGGNVGTLVVAIFPAESLAEVGRAVRVIGVAGLVVLLGATLVALALARRVLRPVSELTATTRRINDNDLTARFDASGDDELAKLGESFNEMLDRLEGGFRAQRDVLDDVAHEMRTPITIVRGHLELLDDDPEERAATVELCLDELDRMNRYVDDLLLVATAQRPDFLDLGPVDAGELAESLLAKVAALGERDWRLVEAPPPGAVVVEADAGRLTQAVVNLAGNAVEHSEVGSSVDLAVVSDGDVLRLSVRDRGTGIDPQVREDLFRRFSRAAGSRTRRPDGTGLGLAIVAAIAEAHGGRVDAEDPRGGGARFTITIPLPDAPTEEVP